MSLDQSVEHELLDRIRGRLEEHARSSRGNLIFLGILCNEPPTNAKGPLGFEAQMKAHDTWEHSVDEAAIDADECTPISDLWDLTEGLEGTRQRIRIMVAEVLRDRNDETAERQAENRKDY